MRNLTNIPHIILILEDKDSAIDIMDSGAYIQEDYSQPGNALFYKETGEDLADKAIHRVNLYISNMLQRGQITEKHATISLAKKIGPNNITYFLNPQMIA